METQVSQTASTQEQTEAKVYTYPLEVREIRPTKDPELLQVWLDGSVKNKEGKLVPVMVSLVTRDIAWVNSLQVGEITEDGERIYGTILIVSGTIDQQYSSINKVTLKATLAKRGDKTVWSSGKTYADTMAVEDLANAYKRQLAKENETREIQL